MQSLNGWRPNQITAILLVFGAIFYALYDVFALTYWGVDSTISVVVNQTAYKYPLGTFLAGFATGGLTVHFLRWAPKESQV